MRVYGTAPEGAVLPVWAPAPGERGSVLRRRRVACAAALVAGLCAGVALVLSSGPDAKTVSAGAAAGWAGQLLLCCNGLVRALREGAACLGGGASCAHTPRG